MAYEEAGMGNWVRCADDIPLTEKGDEIVLPAEWDEWHPTVAGRPVPHTHSPIFEDGQAIMMMQKQGTMVTMASDTTLAPTVERRPTLLTMSSDAEIRRGDEDDDADVISPVSPHMSPTIPAGNPSPLSKEIVVVDVREQKDGSS